MSKSGRLIILPDDDEWYVVVDGAFVARDPSGGTFSNERSQAKELTLEEITESMRKLKELAPASEIHHPELDARPRALEYSYAGATFTIGGVELDVGEVTDFRWYAPSLELEPRYGFDLSCLLRRQYECSAVCEVKIRPRLWRRFIREMRRPRTLGASFGTLMRRAGYGGRKGRRALRRLMSLPDSAWERALG